MIANAMFQVMSAPAEQDFRVNRLQKLLDEKYGGEKVALGRALGHKSGAFVRQMLDRERPITEKTIAKIHSLRGLAGWFDRASYADTLQALSSSSPLRVSEGSPAYKPSTIGHMAKALSSAVADLSSARLAGIANSISAMITNGPTDDQAEVIDTLTQGRTVQVKVDYAKHAWRAAAFSLASAASNPQDRALLERFVETVDQYVAENPPE